jgi:DNA-binding transcriptional ArsR family regulator
MRFSNPALRMAEIDIFSALANPVRREILVRLRRGPRAASELAQGFPIGRPAVSEHLQVLRKAKLVDEEPRGRERYYHLDPRPLSEVELWLEAFNKYWNQRMAVLDALLTESNCR